MRAKAHGRRLEQENVRDNSRHQNQEDGCNSYKAVVKLTFAKGAKLEDPSGLFNASREGSSRRAIDLQEGDTIDATALKASIKEAVSLNTKKGAIVFGSKPGESAC